MRWAMHVRRRNGCSWRCSACERLWLRSRGMVWVFCLQLQAYLLKFYLFQVHMLQFYVLQSLLQLQVYAL